MGLAIQWTYLYPVDDPIYPPALFYEDFQGNWFIIGNFTLLYNEYFEIGWFINNIFNQIFVESFEGIWE